jgi:hypothetical protein
MDETELTFGNDSKISDIIAASPYCLYAAAFCLILSASALPIASIDAASAAPTIYTNQDTEFVMELIILSNIIELWK